VAVLNVYAGAIKSGLRRKSVDGPMEEKGATLATGISVETEPHTVITFGSVKVVSSGAE